MPNITTVTLTAGVPTAGTGTVSTLDNLVSTAGSASPQVLSVQGITSMTALKVDGSAVTQPVSGTVSANATLSAETTKVIGVVRTADGSGNLLTSTSNALDVNIKSLTGGNANGQATMANSAPVAIASDQTAIPVRVTATGNGLTSSRIDSAASTNSTNLKAASGQIANIDVFNVAAYAVYLKFYNKASNPTVGTDTPVWTVPISAGTGFSRTFLTGKTFATGISYAITKLQADSDTTVVAAHDLTGAIDWI